MTVELATGRVCGQFAKHSLAYCGASLEPHDRCERPSRMICRRCGERFVTRCKRTARSQCGPCATSYQHRVRRVFASGYNDNPALRVIMLTITAPSEAAHCLPSGTLCPCTPIGGVHLAEWNACSGTQFNRLIQQLRRQFGPLEYARAAEIQKRGALHFHILLRGPGVAMLAAAFSKRDPFCELRQIIEHHGFGHEVDVAEVNAHSAGYCAKYVSKSCDDRAALPWLDRRSGEVINGHSKYRTWTASRHWGQTMKQIREAQRTWVEERRREGQPPEAAPSCGALDTNTQSYTSPPRPGSNYPNRSPGRAPTGVLA